MPISELKVHEIAEELARRKKGRTVINKEITVSEKGTKFKHNMNSAPAVIPLALSEATIWAYRPPDSTYIYLKSSADTKALVSLIGG